MAIILRPHHHYSVYAPSSSGSAGVSHLCVPQWLQCQGPIFSAAKELLLAVTKQLGLCFIWPLLKLRRRIPSRSFLLGQQRRKEKKLHGFRHLLFCRSGCWITALLTFFFLIIFFFLSALSACCSEATLTGALRDGARRLSSVIINQKPFWSPRFLKFPCFTAALWQASSLHHRGTRVVGIELIRAPTTNTIFNSCCQVAEMPPKTRNVQFTVTEVVYSLATRGVCAAGVRCSS